MRKIKKNEGDMRKKIMSMIWKSDPWLIVSGVADYSALYHDRLQRRGDQCAHGKLLQKSAENRGLDERQCSGGKMRRGLFGER